MYICLVLAIILIISMPTADIINELRTVMTPASSAHKHHVLHAHPESAREIHAGLDGDHFVPEDFLLRRPA